MHILNQAVAILPGQWPRLVRTVAPVFMLTVLAACSDGSMTLGTGSPDQMGANQGSSQTDFLGANGESSAGSNADSTTTDGGQSLVIGSTAISLVESPIGRVLAAGESKHTLYTFANDVAGSSTCAGSCATVWPPLLASSSQLAMLADRQEDADPTSVLAGLDIIERANSDLQWALHGMPLYYYAGDGAEAETNGENFDGSWFVARPLPVELFTAEGFNGQIMRGAGSVNAGINDPALRRGNLDGLTLYIYTRDQVGRSVCNTGCSEDWPPLYADKGAVATGGFTVISRDNGAPQWAYGDQPLYFYIGDNTAGDITGDGADAVWFVVRP